MSDWLVNGELDLIKTDTTLQGRALDISQHHCENFSLAELYSGLAKNGNKKEAVATVSGWLDVCRGQAGLVRLVRGLRLIVGTSTTLSAPRQRYHSTAHTAAFFRTV